MDDRLIKKMEACGWTAIPATNDPTKVIVTHPDGHGPYGSWVEAIEACIEVASGV